MDPFYSKLLRFLEVLCFLPDNNSCKTCNRSRTKTVAVLTLSNGMFRFLCARKLNKLHKLIGNYHFPER